MCFCPCSQTLAEEKERKSECLLPEPPQDDPDCLEIMFKLPNDTRVKRRFLFSQSLTVSPHAHANSCLHYRVKDSTNTCSNPSNYMIEGLDAVRSIRENTNVCRIYCFFMKPNLSTLVQTSKKKYLFFLNRMLHCSFERLIWLQFVYRNLSTA